MCASKEERGAEAVVVLNLWRKGRHFGGSRCDEQSVKRLGLENWRS